MGLIRGETVWTWDSLAARVRAAAGGLAAHGIRHGDRVLVHGRNSAALFETMWATWMLGAVWVPTNFRLTPTEVAYLAKSSGAVAHIFDDAFPEHAATAREAFTPRLNVTIGAGALTWEALASGDPLDTPAEVGCNHPAWFFYTSGTTGHPKAAVLTHSQMAFVVTNHLCDLMPGITERDVSLVLAPLSHGAGIHALTQVARGAASVLPEGDRFDIDDAWRLVARHRVTNMFTVPTILTMLTRDASVDRHDHASLRYVIYAGAPMYRADQLHALEKLGPVLVQYFGLGEVTGNITVLPPHMHLDPDVPVGTCGFARTGMEIAIVDGEICVRGPAVFSGYHDNPEANAKAFAGGWFHTGDLGHLDERGFLFITGRASDMYISGGSNVYPREIEEALLLHPDVAEACVVGVPDARWGEAGVAVIVPVPGAPACDEAILRAHLEGRIARYKTPSRFVTWAELPKSGYGKVAKRSVLERLLSTERTA